MDNQGHFHSDNGLSPVWRQAITWTKAGLLSTGLLGTNFSEISIRILSLSFKKMHLKMSSAKMAAILSKGRWVKSPLKLQHRLVTTSHKKQRILLVTPCLLMRIREFFRTQHCNTTRGRRPSVVLRCEVWINSRIRGSKQWVTNLSHAQTIFVTFWNVSAALKSQLSH